MVEQAQAATRNEKILVSTASKIISESRNQDNLRKCIVVRNISPNAVDIITVNMGFNKATADNGIVLRQNEAFVDSSEAGYQSHQGGITAICATADGVLAIYER